MTLHNNRVEAALAMIAEKQLNPTDVERICGVNRTQIYRWKAGEVKDMRFNSFTKLADSLGYAVAYKNEKIEITPHINTQGDKTMERETEILYDQIALQKEKIERLENDLTNKQVQYQPHPTAFNEMVSMVESAQNTWNWTFLNSPTPMSIANTEGVITSVNLSLVKQLGYGHPDEMKNKSVLEFIHPDDKEKAIAALSKDNRDLICRVLKANGNYCEIHIIAKTFKAEFGDSFSVAQMKCVNSCKDIHHNKNN